MFSNFAVGFFAGLGIGGWVYAKVQHNTGGNTSNSLIVATVAGLGTWILVAMILGMAFKS